MEKITTRVMDLKDELRRIYDADHNGNVGLWKKYSDQMFGPQEALQVWERLGAYLPGLDEDLDFLGPTANIGTHEVAIWDHEQRVRRGRVRFEVSDIRRGHLEVEPSPAVGENSFRYRQADAEHIDSDLGKFDVIWDRKGWLWYLARRCDHQPARVCQTLRTYAHALKEGGIIVVDAAYEFQHLYESRPETNEFGQYEYSTATLIDSRLVDERVQETLYGLYDQHNIGSGKLAVRVLRKKPVVV